MAHLCNDSWWLCVGDVSNNSLLAIKRLLLRREARTKLEFNAPEVTRNLHIYVSQVMCTYRCLVTTI
jgi:hypothetical protein